MVGVTIPNGIMSEENTAGTLMFNETMCNGTIAAPSCIVSHVSGSRRTWLLPSHVTTTADVVVFVAQEEGCCPSCVSIQCGGIMAPISLAPLDIPATFTAILRMPGGKGGFGSMLRAIGAQIEKTTNKEACRDLSGRRLRDINNEKRLKEQLQIRTAKEQERLANRKKKFDALKEEPKHFFSDDSFYKQQEANSQALFNSVDKGFKVAAAQEAQSSASTSASTSGGSDSNESPQGGSSGTTLKRKKSSSAEDKAVKKKRRFFDDLDDSSDDSSDDEHQSSVGVRV